jgi:methylmalonyl-CoA mutase
MGLQGMIDDVIRSSDYDLSALAPRKSRPSTRCALGNRRQLAE